MREACDRAAAGLPAGQARTTVAAVRDRLAENVPRIAVGGRLNAGKSTLVNALLGENLAATGTTECTSLVTWFRHGPANRVVIRFRDGGQSVLASQPLARAVAAVGRPADGIALVEVECSNSVLARHYTLIDTPGLDSLSGLDELSLDAIRQADMLLYVMPHPGENDREALAALRATAGEAGITALSTLGVLSRIDQIGSGDGDPWPAARRIADRYSAQLGSVLAGVVPVLGLLAQTARGATFTESDMRPLRELAGADPAVLRTALYSADDFCGDPRLPLTTPERHRLLALLGLHGIQVALAELARGTGGAAALLRAFGRHSGIDELADRLKRHVASLADSLRARRAIAALDAVSWLRAGACEAAVLSRLREDLQSVRGCRSLRQLELATSLNDLNAGLWQLPPERAGELAALATGTSLAAQAAVAPAATPAELGTVLGTRIAAWRALENTADRAASRRARVVREYLESLFFSLPRCS